MNEIYNFCIWLGKGERGERYFLNETRKLETMRSSIEMPFLSPFEKNEKNYNVRLDGKGSNGYKSYHIPKTQDPKKMVKFFLEKKCAGGSNEYEYEYEHKLRINNESRRVVDKWYKLLKCKNNRGSPKYKNLDHLKRCLFFEGKEDCLSIIADMRRFFDTIKSEKDLKKYIISVKYMFLGLSGYKSKNPWGMEKIPIEDCGLVYDIFNKNFPKMEDEKLRLDKLGRILRNICKKMRDDKTTSIGIKKNDKIFFESKHSIDPISHDEFRTITGTGWDLEEKTTTRNELRDKCGEFSGDFVTTKKFCKQYEGVNNMFYNSVVTMHSSIDSVIVDKECKLLTMEQKETIIPILNGKCSTLVLTGGPGTGKSRTLLALRRCFINSGISVFVLTFTGKASNRLNMEIYDDSNETIVESMTIHRFYHKLKNTREKVKGLLIIDEASTVSVKNLSMISEVFEQGPIVLVGDPNQLPPIEQGRVFNRILKRCNFFTNFFHGELKTNFRANQWGDIMRVVMKIEKGGTIDTNGLKDVFFEKGDTLKVVDLYMDKIENKKSDMDIILILTNMNKNVEDINSKISKRLKSFYLEKNEGEEYYIYPSGGKIYKNKNGSNLVPFGVGARIIFKKNEYSREKRNKEIPQEEYFNGELATVTKVNIEHIEAVTDDGKKILCTKLDNFSLGYAMTVYKSQGSETQDVIFYYSNDYFCKKNTKYVACSRPKSTLTVVGDIAKFIKNAENFESDTPDHFYLFDDLEESGNDETCHFYKGDFMINNSYITGEEISEDICCEEVKENEKKSDDDKNTSEKLKDDPTCSICLEKNILRFLYSFKEIYICKNCIPADEDDIIVCDICKKYKMKNVDCKRCIFSSLPPKSSSPVFLPSLSTSSLNSLPSISSLKRMKRSELEEIAKQNGIMNPNDKKKFPTKEILATKIKSDKRD